MFTKRLALWHMVTDLAGYLASVTIFLLTSNLGVPNIFEVSTTYWKWVMIFNIVLPLGFFVILGQDYAQYKVAVFKIDSLALKRSRGKIRKASRIYKRGELIENQARVLLGVVLDTLNAGVPLKTVNQILSEESEFNLSIILSHRFYRNESSGESVKPFGRLGLYAGHLKVCEIPLWEG